MQTDPAALPATLPLLDGGVLPASDLAGKVTLFVNVASRCGLTPQYVGLQALHAAMEDRGLKLIGVPCNQFGAQEPGSPAEIATFCSTRYQVTFPLLAKQDVNGDGRSELYRFLLGSEAGGGKDISWNFEKLLVGKDGRVIGRFAPTVKPDAPELLAAIEAALSA
jgi:glutathione peroxidase-family protein